VPNHYHAGILLGNTLLETQDIPAARTVFEQLIQSTPDNPVALYRLGILERSEKNYDRAITYLNQALDIDPDLMDVFSGLITVYALQQKFEQAIARCDEHLAARGEDPMVAAVILNLKANILLADNQLENAVTTYEQAILKNPSYVTPYLSLGKIYTAQARFQEAIQTYTALIEKRPDQASAHTLIGTLYENKGQFDLAQTHYKTALEIDPDLIPALNNLAYLYAEQGIHLNQALDMARQARRQTQQAPAVMDTLGWVYFKKSLFDSAAMEFTAAIDIDPSNPVFFYHLGRARLEQGRTDDARDAFETALSLQSDFKGAESARKILADL
jgi:tetratricopeptide (TPR) repeat protein